MFMNTYMSVRQYCIDLGAEGRLRIDVVIRAEPTPTSSR